MPGVKKGDKFYAAILSGDQTNNYPSRKIKNGNKLIKVPNQANDSASLEELADGSQPLLADSDLNISDKFTDPKGKSDLSLDMSILDQFSGYNDQADYTLIPSKGEAEYNSNSFARSISEKAGVNNYPDNLPGYDPGTSNVLPNNFFSQSNP